MLFLSYLRVSLVVHIQLTAKSLQYADLEVRDLVSHHYKLNWFEDFYYKIRILDESVR